MATAIAVAKRRKTAYAALMDQVNDDKLPISPEVPAIVVVLDEGAEAVAMNRGQKSLAAKLDELVSIARAARVQVLASALRATAEILPPSIKAQAGTRLFMRPDDEHEVAQLLGWRTGVSLDDVSVPGAGLLRTADMAAVAPMRAWRITPAQITALTAVVTDRRPHLDPASAAAAGNAYTTRWTRYLAWHASQGGTAMPEHIPGTPNTGSNANTPSSGSSNASSGSAPMSADKPGGELTGMAALGPAYEALQASLAELRKVGEAAERRRTGGEQAGGTGGDDDVDATFAEIISGWDEAGEDPTLTATTAEGPARMLAILREAGPAGVRFEALVTQIETEGIATRATVARWLRAAVADGSVTKADKGLYIATKTGDGA